MYSGKIAVPPGGGGIRKKKNETNRIKMKQTESQWNKLN
jgi:hypothetical protein